MDKLIFSVFMLTTANIALSQNIKVDTIHSDILKKDVPVTIMLPENYNVAVRYPVFYLLHWWGGNNESFLNTGLISELKKREIIVVTPTADTSWYINSYSNPDERYEDFMTTELFSYIDKKYNTNAKKQAIGGYSMGGYGALMIGLKHPERFHFIADISGVINAPFKNIPLTPDSPLNFIINSVRYSFGDSKAVSNDTDIFYLIKNIKSSEDIFIYMATGKQDEFDFIIPQHKIFIEELDKQKIKYKYAEYEGSHFSDDVFNACLQEMMDKLDEVLK